MILITGLVLSACFSMAASFLNQPVVTGKMSLILTDNERKGRNIPVDIYFPLDSGKTELTYISQSGQKYPVICFAHGYRIDPDSYSNIREALVPEGYILIFPKTERGIFPSHNELARDIGFIIKRMEQLGRDTASVFFESVDTLYCAMGHSMGGGAAFLAAAMYPDISSLAALAPYNTRPSAIMAASAVHVPALLITGKLDCVTKPEKHQIPMYESLGSSNKTIIHIKGGNHCQMAEDNSLCRIGENLKSCKPEITREEQHKIINRYLIRWLDFNLKKNFSAGYHFDNEIISDSSVEYSRSGSLYKK